MSPHVRCDDSGYSEGNVQGARQGTLRQHVDWKEPNDQRENEVCMQRMRVRDPKVAWEMSVMWRMELSC